MRPAAHGTATTVVGARGADVDFLEGALPNVADKESAEVAIEAGPEGIAQAQRPYFRRNTKQVILFGFIHYLGN